MGAGAATAIDMSGIDSVVGLLQSCQERVGRLVNGIGSGLDSEGLIIDRFESCDIVHTYANDWLQHKIELADVLRAGGISSAVLWNRDADLKETTRRGAEVLFGTPQEAMTVTVDGVPLWLKPFKTASGGIFLDTRDVRRELVAESKGKRVLNLFCFTGSLGLAAAVGGAREVTQVDISQSILDWAKENAELQSKNAAVIKYWVKQGQS